MIHLHHLNQFAMSSCSDSRILGNPSGLLNVHIFQGTLWYPGIFFSRCSMALREDPSWPILIISFSTSVSAVQFFPPGHSFTAYSFINLLFIQYSSTWCFFQPSLWKSGPWHCLPRAAKAGAALRCWVCYKGIKCSEISMMSQIFWLKFPFPI